MSRIQQAIRARLQSGERAFVPYLTAGFPDVDVTVACALALAREGATGLELGVPFSDPIADGPVVERASGIALASGMTPSGVLELAATIHEQAPDLPLIIMSYVNPLMQFQGIGGRSFADSAREAGVDGILITDLPPEEPHELWATVAASGLDPILLVSPTTLPERIRAIAGRARGFVYCVSRLGVTGKGPGVDERLRELVATAREHTGLPALIGFGVGGAADARRAAELADGVVVGSALLERLEAPDPVAAATALAREIRSGLTSPSPPR